MRRLVVIYREVAPFTAKSAVTVATIDGLRLSGLGTSSIAVILNHNGFKKGDGHKCQLFDYGNVSRISEISKKNTAERVKTASTKTIVSYFYPEFCGADWGYWYDPRVALSVRATSADGLARLAEIYAAEGVRDWDGEELTPLRLNSHFARGMMGRRKAGRLAIKPELVVERPKYLLSGLSGRVLNNP